MFEYGGPKTFLLTAAVGLAIAPANPASTEVTSDVDQRNATSLDIEVEGKIAHSLGAVSDVLLDLDGFQRWFPALREWRVLSRGKENAVVYGRQALPWPLRDRDYVVEYRWRTTRNAEFILTAVARPEADPPPQRGVLRLEEMTTEWRLIADGGETTARYTYRGLVDVPLPDGIVQSAWEAHSAKVIEALADEVSRRAN